MIDVIIKLGLSVLLGGAIGLEREFGQKPAGLRTNILICMGSTMMMALSGVMLAGKPSGAADLLRIAAGVITGMGFIGAGTIIRASGHVHGLTTASTLWAVTGLGLVIGAGYYLIAAVFTVFVVLTLIVFRQIERILPRRASYVYVLNVKNHSAALNELRAIAAAHHLRLDDVILRRMDAAASLTFSFAAADKAAREFTAALSALGEIDEMRGL